MTGRGAAARALVTISCCLAAVLLAGCVEITNPQFDARYRIAVRPVGKPVMAVVAVRMEPDVRVPLPVSARPDPVSARLLVIDTAAHTSVATIPLDGVVALSDVGVRDGRPKVLATLATGYAEVDLFSEEITTLSVSPAPGLLPLGGALDASGTPVTWRASPDRVVWSVSRGSGADEETASVSLRRGTLRHGVEATESPVTRRLILSSSAAWQVVLYCESTASIRDAAGAVSETRSIAPWTAHLGTHTIKVGPGERWPSRLGGRVDRAVARFGPPVEVGGGLGAIRVDTGASAASALSILPTTTIVFEPGGERYLQMPQRADGVVTERSLVSTRTTTVYREDASGVRPLAYAGGRFAYSSAQLLTTDPLARGTAKMRRSLHLYDPVTRKDEAVFSEPDSAVLSPAFEFLGSFSR